MQEAFFIHFFNIYLMKTTRKLKFGKYSAALIAATGVVFFSAKAIFVKAAYEYNVDPVSLLLIRMVIALPFYVIVLIITTIQQKENPFTGKDYLWLFILGILGYYLASYFDFSGLNYISASLERLILFVYPTLVILISALVLKRSITLQQKLAIGVTYTGIFITFYKYQTLSGVNSNVFLGVLLILASALSYACYLIGSGNLIPRIGPVRFTSFAMIVSCLAVLIHFTLKGDGKIIGHPVEVYKLGFGMAFISTIIPSFMLAEAIKRIGASNVAIIGSIGPISTIILATIFLGERITVFQMIGTIIVISGVMLIGIRRT